MNAGIQALETEAFKVLVESAVVKMFCFFYSLPVVFVAEQYSAPRPRGAKISIHLSGIINPFTHGVLSPVEYFGE